jgi:hypothetical protein
MLKKLTPFKKKPGTLRLESSARATDVKLLRSSGTYGLGNICSCAWYFPKTRGGFDDWKITVQVFEPKKLKFQHFCFTQKHGKTIIWTSKILTTKYILIGQKLKIILNFKKIEVLIYFEGIIKDKKRYQNCSYCWLKFSIWELSLPFFFPTTFPFLSRYPGLKTQRKGI